VTFNVMRNVKEQSQEIYESATESACDICTQTRMRVLKTAPVHYIAMNGTFARGKHDILSDNLKLKYS
jgi:hypothetical protein